MNVLDREVIGRFSSRTLAGRDLTVPDDLEVPTLLCFAYQQRQQGDVDTWLAVVADDDRVGVLEVPVLGRRWRPARAFIDGGMASNMDEATRSRTMCVYTDVDRFRSRVLGVDETEICAVLVGRDGQVAFSALGPVTPAAATALRAALDRGT